MSFADKAIKYFNGLKTPELNLNQTELLNPYSSKEVKEIVRKFFRKFYDDDNERIFIIGINPGRFGGGLTGISFTDPVALREQCGIENNLGNQKELSSKFIYSVANRFGGVEKFFSKVFLTALYPFALLKKGKNYNYYDDKVLAEYLKSEIVKNIKSQIKFSAYRDFAILLGKKNAIYFEPLNSEYKFFKKIIVVEHPRYIMQYKLKQMNDYIKKYIKAVKEV
ncbi:uracil-DNA glycosylase family protein [Ignavibacterium album]|uniref:uracil-DNA glycosylase family protein n=1 Tax=Ignavibacterium album TaxID=591197 RepID=UPI0035B7C3A5